MNESAAALADKLSNLSAKVYPIPSDRIAWQSQLDREQWFTSPEMISLYGTTAFDQLNDRQQKILSFWEAVNFYSLNINGEIPLVQGLTTRLFAQGNGDIVRYLHHFIDEENKHMQYFGRFCLQYAGKVYPDKKVLFPREYAPGEEELLFFLKVMIFEEIADHHNVVQGKDERLHPIARKINQLHHQDEARHLIFGRQLVCELFEKYAPQWSPETLAGFRVYIEQYLTATWREYYNPEVYRDAGLEELGLGTPYELFQQAYQSEHAGQHRQQVSSKCIAFLLEHNILCKEPRL